MSEIDVEKAVRDKINNDFTGTGLDLSDFDFSGLTISLISINYTPRPDTISPPTTIDTKTFTNCTLGTVGHSFKTSYKREYRLHGEANVGLTLGKIVKGSTSVTVPATPATPGASASAGADQSQSVTFGVRFSIDYTASSSEEESTSFPVAPCSEVTATATHGNASFSGTMTVNLKVSGFAHFNVKYTGRWFGTGSVDYPIDQNVSVDGTYSGTTGQSISVKFEQRRAKCEGDCKQYKVGQVMIPGTMEKPGTGSDDVGSGEGTPRKEKKK